MIHVYLEGHDYKYEIKELIKVFYFNTDVHFTNSEALTNNQSLLIISKLLWNGSKPSVITNVYKNNLLIASDKIDDASKIDIKENDFTKVIKIAIKQSLFNVMMKINSIKVPWGILTGIRPTKIVQELLNKNIDKKEIIDILTKEYKLDINKANLALNIAVVEKEILDSTEKNRFSLYVNIPFCPTRCLYCSFLSNPVDKFGDLIDIYTDKLIYEIEKVKTFLGDKNIDTVYIGGGTPTSLPVKKLEKIIKCIYETFIKENIREITVEAGRPDTITKEMLMMLKNCGIKRISINPQTMCEKTLKLIGRKHTPKDIIDAYRLAKEIGFEVVNMDIIVGLPEEGTEELRMTMEEISKLNPDNLTVHTMAIKRASKLRENLEEYKLTSQETIEAMLSIANNYAKEMKMYPYYMYRQKQILGNFENVGYCKEGKECIYNILIMEEKQTIVAVGAGGVSKIYYPEENRIERVPNVKDIKGYIERIEEMVQRKKKYLKTLT